MTAPTATIIGPLVYPGNGRPVAARAVTVRCVGPDGAVLLTSDGGLVGQTTIHTDASGRFSVPLVLNSDIDTASGVGPPGTYWALTVGVTPAVSWHVRLDAGDAGSTILIGDGAHTIVDPQPRSWVPLSGPAGTQTGGLAARPIAPPSPLVYVATDADDPISTWDGTSWSTVHAARSRLLTSLSVADPPGVALPANTFTTLAWSQTADFVAPGGLIQVTTTAFSVVADTFAAPGTQTEGFVAAMSTDSGATWNTILPTQAAGLHPQTALTTVIAPITMIRHVDAGTTVRVALQCRVASAKTVDVLTPVDIAVMALQ